MAKDPAFLFYSQDFFTGCATLSFEDKGKFIHLLCLMHQQGRMNEETIRFLVGSISVNLKSKFLVDENGFWYNNRLEEEIKKRNKFTKSRHDNGLKGGRPPKNKKPLGLPTDNHMGNENIDYINSLTNGNGVWSAEKKLFLNAEQWQYKQCSEYQISKVALMGYIEAFLKCIDLQEDFKSEKELKKHCANWLRKNVSVDKTKALEEKRILPENYFTDV